MLARLRSHLTFSNVVSLTALFVALGGSAYALTLPKNSVGTKQLKRGAVTGAKIKRDAVTSSKVKNASLLAGDFKPGQLPSGPKGDTGPGGPTGAMGATGAPGTARAYGLVSKTGDLSRSKNVTAVSHPSDGIYCIALAASIDVGQTGLVATPDYNNDDTNNGANQTQAAVEWGTLGLVCPGSLEVRTFQRSVSTSGSPDSDVRVVNMLISDEGFFFMVP